MPRFVALLRSINVGGHNVKMEELRQLFARMGFSNVETFIASGNVLFESASKNADALAKNIEQTLEKTLGYEVATFVRTSEELAAIAAYNPFDPQEDDAGLYIAFLSKPPTREIQDTLMSFKTGTDDFHIHHREVYWLCRTRFSDSTFSGPRLEKVLQAKTTVRNSTTIRKLAAKFDAP